ncbi:MAG: hypothetical protein NVS1B10_00710 [Candidatus Saccharimonadales bacterium]
MTDAFVDSNKSLKLVYSPLPRFPSASADFTFKVDQDLSYEDLRTYVVTQLNKLQADDMRYNLSPLDIYWNEKEPTKKNITFRLVIANYNRTLSDTEISDMLNKLSKNAMTDLRAIRA